jgi:outer membrane biosynthesis protein TonB
MTNPGFMTNANDANFESRKNMQAGSITLAILAVLFLLFFLVGWTTPSILQPQPEEGMEVNLGNSDAGLGNDQPFLPGKPAPQDQQNYTPPKQAETQKEDVKDPATDDKDPDAPEIKKPPVSKAEATKIAEKEVPKKVTPKAVEPAPPAPKPPTAKAVFKGVNGTGTGGNEADSYKKGGSEGIAGGKGDQGKPGGNPDSKNYEGGGHGNSGFNNIRGLGNRKIRSLPAFTDDFDQNGKVVVQIKFDRNGNCIDASIVQMGTTGNSDQKAIALRKARQVKISSDPNANDEQVVTFDMNFKVTN